MPQTPRTLLKSLVLACALASCAPAVQTSARQAASNEPGLREVLEEMDRTSLAGARVGVSDRGTPDYPDALPEPITGVAKFTFVYSQGFRLANLEGCTLTLRNDDVKVLRPSRRGASAPGPEARYVMELYVALDKVSWRKGRKPYRHTKDAEKARVFGPWRAEYKKRRRRSQHIGGVSIFPIGQRERHNFFGYEKLSFTFDTREASEQFDSAFRRAVKLCQPK